MTTEEILQESGTVEPVADELAAPDIAEEVTEELPPLEPFPKWDKRYKDVFSELGTIPERGREYQQAMHDLYKEQQGYATKVEQERAEALRRAQQADVYNQAIAPYQQMILNSGATPDVFIRQALGLASQLENDPRETLLRLAQRAGVDLAQATQDQPYIDPQVKALQDELRQLRDSVTQREQRQAAEFQQRALAEINNEIGTFASAQDDSGNPLHPHFETVQPVMAELIHGREVQRRNNPALASLTMQEAYERACKLSPEVEQAGESERKAKEAAKRAAEAKKAADASKRVAGKHTGKDASGEEDIKAEILKNLRKQAA